MALSRLFRFDTYNALRRLIIHLSDCSIRKNNKSGSSEIWNDKLKLLHNKAHRETERMEINATVRRCRRPEERQRCSVWLADILG